MDNARNQKKIQWQKLLDLLSSAIHERELKLFRNKPGLHSDDYQQIEAVRRKIRQSMLAEISALTAEERSAQRIDSQAGLKKILLELEIVPFRPATRATMIDEDGKTWRHDGGSVSFKLAIPHDKLEIYSPDGEFIAHYPVDRDGQVSIEDLEPGVYILYLRGRRILTMKKGD